MSDEPVVPDQETTAEGYTVFWEPAHYPADDIEAELPDGTRLRAILQFGGRRVGFERPLPKGTQLLLRGQPAWRPIGRDGQLIRSCGPQLKHGLPLHTPSFKTRPVFE